MCVNQQHAYMLNSRYPSKPCTYKLERYTIPATMLSFNNTKFLKSAQQLSQLPEESQAEIAFAGRSNAGKSSALNTITNIKGLAKTSKTPGRTQLLNYFEVAEGKFLVDLPGYGYAKVSRKVQQEWEKTLSAYIETRKQLNGIVIIMDIRHPLKEHDQMMIDWVNSYEIPIHILLTKADKLKRNAANKAFFEVKDALAIYGDTVSVQLFSSTDSTGVAEARTKLNEWLHS